MAATNSTTYGSLGINSELIPVIGRQAVSPDPGLGPIFTGPGQSPLQTIPKAPSGTVGSNGGGKLTPMTLILLAGMAIVGILILRYVHWRG